MTESRGIVWLDPGTDSVGAFWLGGEWVDTDGCNAVVIFNDLVMLVPIGDGIDGSRPRVVRGSPTFAPEIAARHLNEEYGLVDKRGYRKSVRKAKAA